MVLSGYNNHSLVWGRADWVPLSQWQEVTVLLRARFQASVNSSGHCDPLRPQYPLLSKERVWGSYEVMLHLPGSPPTMDNTWHIAVLHKCLENE